MGVWCVAAAVCAVNVALWSFAYYHQGENPACGMVVALAVAGLVRSLYVLRELRRGKHWIAA